MSDELIALQSVTEVANEQVRKQAVGTGTYRGAFTTYGAADAFGVPAEIVESLIQPNGLLDRFDWEWDNRPVIPADIFAVKEGGDDGSFAEGHCPTTVASTIGRVTYAAKSFGRCSDRLTMAAMASKQHAELSTRNVRTAKGVTTLTDEWEFQMFKVLQGISRVREYLLINGDASVNANNFDGLLRIIRTNRMDINGNHLEESDSIVHDEHCTEVTVRKLEEVIGALEDKYVDIGDIVMTMRPGLFRHLAYKISLNYLDPEAKKQELLAGRVLPLGGADIPVETTQFMPRTGAAQSWCSHILFLTFNYLGLPSLYNTFFNFSTIVKNYPELFASPVGAGGLSPSPFVMFTTERGTECMSSQFCLAAHGDVVALAPQSLAKVVNVSYSSLGERVMTNP